MCSMVVVCSQRQGHVQRTLPLVCLHSMAQMTMSPAVYVRICANEHTNFKT